MAKWSAAFAAVLALLLIGHAESFCSPGLPCWPSAADVAALRQKLNPESDRRLLWAGPGNPYPTAIPADGEGNQQPMFGYFKDNGLQPIYVQNLTEESGTCFVDDLDPYCFVTIRNGPHEGWQPSFVVFPTTWLHVQETMLFAVAHNLKVCVAGTGHDFLNRHSCNEGVLIRTIFLKGAEVDLTDAKKLGSPSVRLGSGMVFGEAHKAVAEQNKLVTSGWAATVGVVGWSLGGGHGPMVPSHGLGVDNILEVELIAANGDRVIANAAGTSRQLPGETTWTHDPSAELWLAMRGGGGSTWGVVTAITLRIHDIPEGGFTRVKADWMAPYCDDGITALHELLDAYFAWAQTLDTKWGGLMFFSTQRVNASAETLNCNTGWVATTTYYYQGSANATGFREKWAELTGVSAKWRVNGSLTEEGFPNWWELGKTLTLEPISVTPNAYGVSETYAGGVPSVMLSRQAVANGTVAALVKRHMAFCQSDSVCTEFQFYGDITGNLGSLEMLGAAASNVSISSGFRNAFLHMVFTTVRPGYIGEIYALGANSYFSESAYNLTDWQTRYYGDKYPRLLAVKTAMDPTNRLTCHHCVAAIEPPSPPPPPRSPPPPPRSPPPPHSAATGLYSFAATGVALVAAAFSFLFFNSGF